MGEHLRLRHSVELVGIKHVGISNFLRFFLYHERIVKTYVSAAEKHMFVEVDLNDLIEKDIFAFWTLTFKRLVDKVEKFHEVQPEDRQEVGALFLDAIQSRNFFLTTENLREALKILVRNNIAPTIFFVRFDRLREVVSEEFLANLAGLLGACAEKLAYVFTSFRPLDDLAPAVFSRRALSVFSHEMYMKPAEGGDMRVIFELFFKKYNISPDSAIGERLIEMCGGHVQYLQIALIIINQMLSRGRKTSAETLFPQVSKDERVKLVSEEIWDSLTELEKSYVLKIAAGEQIDANGEPDPYLRETGLVKSDNFDLRLFSPLFEDFVKKLERSGRREIVDFTKKENSLFNLLEANLGQICEREAIVGAVWPEYEEMGVSDWTIDQLVARLRTKLKLQKSPYAVKTVRTRGYRLVEES